MDNPLDSPDQLALLLCRVIDGAEARPDQETLTAILREAGRFATDRLAPLAVAADRAGCRLEQGRVRSPDGHRAVWRDFGAAGWTGLALPEAAGGQALPLAVHAAVQDVLDGANPAFGMLPLAMHAAARSLARHAPPALCAEWLPRLAEGSWGATICISEPQAGSDVGRIRSRAEAVDGLWRITGEKCWISYGDHDLTERIGHLLLARRPDAPAGTRGLSLFLVPDRLADGRRNGITVMRLEEKLGLHGSPTCALAFEAAEATPIGPPGRGLSCLFAMITAMRLGVAVQGAGSARRVAAIAEAYAAGRAQGGDPDRPAVPITGHAEIRRLLLTLRLRAEAARLIALQAAAWADQDDRDGGPAGPTGAAGDGDAGAMAALLLPVAKTWAAEAAFANADMAIQVMGGAGYVRDWPVERILRDCRVFSIYEGTSAIQALDLLHRRVLPDGGRRLSGLLAALAPDPDLRRLIEDSLPALSAAPRRVQDGAALPFLRLVGQACADGLLRRAGRLAGPLAPRYQALADFHQAEFSGEAARLAQCCRGAAFDPAFETVFAAG